MHRPIRQHGRKIRFMALGRLNRRSAMPLATGFHPANFKHSLTLFSKFFASFPHGTCSLSVSGQYLALDGIYHPLQAALPSSPTLRKRIVHQSHRSSTGFSPSLIPRSKGFLDRAPKIAPLQTTIQKEGAPSVLRLELYPLHSPLLGVSRFFSSPPLSDMLKFSG